MDHLLKGQAITSTRKKNIRHQIIGLFQDIVPSDLCLFDKSHVFIYWYSPAPDDEKNERRLHSMRRHCIVILWASSSQQNTQTGLLLIWLINEGDMRAPWLQANFWLNWQRQRRECILYSTLVRVGTMRIYLETAYLFTTDVFKCFFSILVLCCFVFQGCDQLGWDYMRDARWMQLTSW